MENRDPSLRRRDAVRRAQAEYADRHPRSRACWQRALGAMPGGDTRSVVYHAPFPLALVEGHGCRVRDADGHDYLDFLNNFTSLIHGHAHPAIVDAVVARIRQGTALPALVPEQADLARLLVDRVPGVDQVRFCNSGTEATLFAVQTARAHSGRSDIIKMEGGYHGGHDVAAVSVHPDLDKAGPADRPLAVPESAGIDRRAAAGVHVVPFNDAAALGRTLDELEGRIAAVLMEPVLGQAGYIPPEPGYLEEVRRLCTERQVVLIFDEVQTLRVGYGGAQAKYGVVPDLTALGKIIGGGFPVGAFGGPKDIMQVYDPTRSGSIKHSGTFNGNPVTMAGGRVAMELLDAAALQRLETLAERLEQGIEDGICRADLPAHVTRSGSLLSLHFTSPPVHAWRDTLREPPGAGWLFYFELLQRGIHTAPGRSAFNLSTPMDEAIVDHALAAIGDALAVVAEAWRP